MTTGIQENQELGVNVWWTCPGAMVDGETAQSVLVANGFDKEDMKLPSRHKEVSRAVRSFNDRRSKKNRRIGEVVKNTKDKIVYGILEREQADNKVSFEQQTTISMDKQTGEVTSQGNLKEAFDKALDEFKGKCTEEDIRNFLREVVRMCHGVSKRPTGGIYFVPSRYSQFILDAQKVIASFNSRSRIYAERVMNGSAERQNVWDSVEIAVEETIAEQLAAVGRIERVSSIKGHLDEIEDTSKLMAVYQELLGEEAKYEALAEKIEDAVRVVSEKMRAAQVGIDAKLAAKMAAKQAAKQAIKIPAANSTASPANPTANSVTGKAKGGLTIGDAAVKVLSEDGKQMHYREIVDKAIGQGIYASASADPYATFNGTLTQAISNGTEKRVKKVGRGVYELAA